MPQPRPRAATVVITCAVAALLGNAVLAAVEEQWAAALDTTLNRVCHGGAFAVDHLGNAYAATHTSNGTNYDFVTMKFDGAGNLLWSRRFDRRGGHDFPVAVTVNKLGAVFVTGSSGFRSGNRQTITTVKYSAGGNLRWFATYDRPKPELDGYPTTHVRSIGTDAFGSIYITGYLQTTNAFEDHEYFTVKYNLTTGRAIWTNRINQMRSDHALAGMGFDDGGNIYVAGGHNFDDEEDNVKVVVAKYHRDGRTLWKKRFDAPSYANAMTVDKTGNTYVTGNRATIKVDTTGNLCWTLPFPGFGAQAVTVDRNGNVIVAGLSPGFSEPSARTVKYDPNGNVLWIRNAHTGDENYPARLAADESGNIYLTYRWERWSDDSSSFGQQVRCYSPAGAEVWSAGRWSWLGTMPVGPAVNPAGHAFVGWLYSHDSALELAKYIQPYAPPLSIHSKGRNLELSWAGLATNVVLETSQDLATVLNWEAVTNRPAIIGGENLVTVPIKGSAQFFRLRAR